MVFLETSQKNKHSKAKLPQLQGISKNSKLQSNMSGIIDQDMEIMESRNHKSETPMRLIDRRYSQHVLND